MIPFIRSTQFHDNREPVGILVELHFSAEKFNAPAARPIASFFLNTTQSALATNAGTLETTGMWGDADVLVVGQQLLDGHPEFGGNGLVLQHAPAADEPA